MSDEIRRIRALAKRLERLEDELRAAMVAAHRAGIPIRPLADAAGVSFEKARRIVKGLPWR